MWLDCGKHGLVELGRITPTLVVAKEPKFIPPGYGELIVTIDGVSKRISVNLTHGFSNRNAAKFVIVDGSAPF